MDRFLSIETRSGEAVRVGGLTLTPFSRALVLKWPGSSGGLVWNRPASLLAQTEDGQEQVIPIPDVTRQVQWSLLGAGLLGSLLAWLIFRRNR